MRKCKLYNHSADLCKEKYMKIHELLVANLKKEDRLKSEAKDLHGRLTMEINKFENCQKHQKQNEQTLQELAGTIADVKKEADQVEERKGLLKNEMQQLENDKTDIEAELAD